MKPRSETTRRWSATWSRLAVRERRMLALLFFEGLTPQETARALGCTLADVQRTVDSRLERLRRQLRLRPFVTVGTRGRVAVPAVRRRAA